MSLLFWMRFFAKCLHEEAASLLSLFISSRMYFLLFHCFLCMLNLHSVLRNNGERRPSIIKYGYILSQKLGTVLSADGPHALSYVLVIVDAIIAGVFQLSVCCAQSQHEGCSMILQKQRAQRQLFKDTPVSWASATKKGEGLKHD